MKTPVTFRVTVSFQIHDGSTKTKEVKGVEKLEKVWETCSGKHLELLKVHHGGHKCATWAADSITHIGMMPEGMENERPPQTENAKTRLLNEVFSGMAAGHQNQALKFLLTCEDNCRNDTKHIQLRERLYHEVSEVENLTEEIYKLKEEFAEAYAKLESELAETKLALASNQKGESQ